MAEAVLHDVRRALVDHIGWPSPGPVTTPRAGPVTPWAESKRLWGNADRYGPASAGTLRGLPQRVRRPRTRSRRRLHPPGTTVHGSCSVWPAIFAAAATRPTTGREALVTCALGFEVETRVAHSAGQAHYNTGWHVTGTSGHVGAAAAAARTVRLGAEQVEHAIAARAAQAVGLRVMAGSDLKSMHPGKAAMDGVLAAALGAQGLTAGAAALEGDFGYLAVI
ncbi:MmgE/PrpD family protein [Mycobacterium sp. ITM-2016-00317]|uniref:MmgE/PrpD family protein n=1 Tax=Mycobacterium sp. ITM-2016-00317 TaxID=2099694 RepID=UPI000D4A65FE